VGGASAGGGAGHVAPPMEFGPHCGGKEVYAVKSTTTGLINLDLFVERRKVPQ